MKDKKTFFSFGGGVQSTAIALLLVHEPQKFIEKGLQLPQTIIFADTGAEPLKVYDHVERMQDLLTQNGFDFLVVTKKDKDGNSQSILSTRGFAQVPWFTRSSDGKVGMLKRQCTADYKVKPIQATMKSIMGFSKGQRVAGKVNARTWIGISTDESQRMKISTQKWIENVYPLIAIGWNRTDCAVYGRYRLNYPIPKSSCFFCPYTHSQEWERRKQTDPEQYKQAVELDNSLRAANKPKFLKNDCFVHRSGLPLDDVVSNQPFLQLGAEYGFARECEGHCGV